MSNSSDMPPFGKILNAGIQAVKQLCTRSNGITPKVFEKKVNEIGGVQPQHLELSYIDPDMAFYVEDEEDMIDSCYDALSDLTVKCLVAIGAVKTEYFNLEANLGHSFAHLISFDKEITPES